MGKYFGTDGIRGVVGETLTGELASICGRTLGRKAKRILVGGDTRVSREYLTLALAQGVVEMGANITNIGICTTPGIAHITKKYGFDYGVVISASHNPPYYNGIKIFDNNGVKLGDEREEELEEEFLCKKKLQGDFGKYEERFGLTKIYEEYLKASVDGDLTGLKIVLDCACGASCKIAKKVFKSLGAKVVAINSSADGKRINKECGSTSPLGLCKAIKKYDADMGFAFDGDADRIIACDEKGKVLDGDMILFVLAKYLKKTNKLNGNIVVGTTHTNMGIRNALKHKGIKFVEANVGDKYVIEKMEQGGVSLGGEKSGHIILKEYSTTGDGILAGLKLAELVKSEKKRLSRCVKVKLYPEVNIDVVVRNKEKIVSSDALWDKIETLQIKLSKKTRILVRASGTEPKVRIMVESENLKFANDCAREIEKMVCALDEV